LVQASDDTSVAKIYAEVITLNESKNLGDTVTTPAELGDMHNCLQPLVCGGGCRDDAANWDDHLIAFSTPYRMLFNV